MLLTFVSHENGQAKSELTASARIPAHAPFVRSRKAYEGMHQRFYNQLSINGRHKHRAPDDVIIPMLHNEWVMQEGGRSHGVQYVHNVLSCFSVHEID